LVCALGIGTEEAGKVFLPGSAEWPRSPVLTLPVSIAASAAKSKASTPSSGSRKKELKKMGRFIQVALAGADFAVRMSGWKPEQSDLDEVGVYVSSGIGGFDIIEREHGKLLNAGRAGFRHFLFRRRLLIWLPGIFRFAMERAANSATATACSASAHAIGDSFKIIRARCGGNDDLAAVRKRPLRRWASADLLR